MRRVSLLLSAVGLLVACNKNDYNEEPELIYFADKIHEEILAVGSTETITTDYEFKYRGVGLVTNESVKISTPSTITRTLTYETSYDGSFPKTTLYKVGGTTVNTTTYDQYIDRGRIKNKTIV